MAAQPFGGSSMANVEKERRQQPGAIFAAEILPVLRSQLKLDADILALQVVLWNPGVPRCHQFLTMDVIKAAAAESDLSRIVYDLTQTHIREIKGSLEQGRRKQRRGGE